MWILISWLLRSQLIWIYTVFSTELNFKEFMTRFQDRALCHALVYVLICILTKSINVDHKNEIYCTQQSLHFKTLSCRSHLNQCFFVFFLLLFSVMAGMLCMLFNANLSSTKQKVLLMIYWSIMYMCV